MRGFVVVLVAGCGRVGFTPLEGTADSQTSDTLRAGSLTYREAVLGDSPIGYWRLADTGAMATDETGTTQGMYTGGCQRGQPSTISGDSNAAVRFDGQSCSMSLGSTYAFTGRAPYSLEVWYRPADLTMYEALIAKQTRLGSMPDDGYMIFNAQGVVYAERSQAAMNVRTADSPVTVGETYHLVATYDGNELALYKNGVLAAPRVADTASLPVYSATTVIGAASKQDQFFATGTLDEVAIYDHALSADQIARHYDIGKNGPL